MGTAKGRHGEVGQEQHLHGVGLWAKPEARHDEVGLGQHLHGAFSQQGSVFEATADLAMAMKTMPPDPVRPSLGPICWTLAQ